MGRALDSPIASRLRATTHGAGERCLVLSHGFGTSQSVWAPFIDRYGSAHRIITYDLAYLGQCQTGERLYQHMSTYADDLVALLEEQGVNDATLVGHSASGMFGLLAAVTAPERFARLVLLNASPRYLDDEDYRGGLTMAELEGIFAAIQENYMAWVLGFAPAVTAATGGRGLSEFSSSLLDLRPDVTLAVLRSIYDADLRGMLGQVACPVDVLQSRFDMAVPVAVGAYLSQHLPSARLHLLDTEGHLPHLVEPERLWPVFDEILLGAQ